MEREMPMLMASAYTSNTMQRNGGIADYASAQTYGNNLTDLAALMKQGQVQQPQTTESQMSAARIIKVFIADPNENVPLEKRVLYTGDEKLTDLTDQELFFDVPIADLLAKHNAERAQTLDKPQSAKFGRDIFLEPAKIRDLKMVVVTVATF